MRKKMRQLFLQLCVQKKFPQSQKTDFSCDAVPRQQTKRTSLKRSRETRRKDQVLACPTIQHITGD